MEKLRNSTLHQLESDDRMSEKQKAAAKKRTTNKNWEKDGKLSLTNFFFDWKSLLPESNLVVDVAALFPPCPATPFGVWPVTSSVRLGHWHTKRGLISFLSVLVIVSRWERSLVVGVHLVFALSVWLSLGWTDHLRDVEGKFSRKVAQWRTREVWIVWSRSTCEFASNGQSDTFDWFGNTPTSWKGYLFWAIKTVQQNARHCRSSGSNIAIVGKCRSTSDASVGIIAKRSAWFRRICVNVIFRMLQLFLYVASKFFLSPPPETQARTIVAAVFFLPLSLYCFIIYLFFCDLGYLRWYINTCSRRGGIARGRRSWCWFRFDFIVTFFINIGILFYEKYSSGE